MNYDELKNDYQFSKLVLVFFATLYFILSILAIKSLTLVIIISIIYIIASIFLVFFVRDYIFYYMAYDLDTKELKDAIIFYFFKNPNDFEELEKLENFTDISDEKWEKYLYIFCDFLIEFENINASITKKEYRKICKKNKLKEHIKSRYNHKFIFSILSNIKENK
ncbi:MAG: hypothetical protein RSB67_00165 [Clostridia bacterium]